MSASTVCHLPSTAAKQYRIENVMTSALAYWASHSKIALALPDFNSDFTSGLVLRSTSAEYCLINKV